jgi:hypothetical protein
LVHGESPLVVVTTPVCSGRAAAGRRGEGSRLSGYARLRRLAHGPRVLDPPIRLAPSPIVTPAIAASSLAPRRRRHDRHRPSRRAPSIFRDFSYLAGAPLGLSWAVRIAVETHVRHAQ